MKKKMNFAKSGRYWEGKARRQYIRASPEQRVQLEKIHHEVNQRVDCMLQALLDPEYGDRYLEALRAGLPLPEMPHVEGVPDNGDVT